MEWHAEAQYDCVDLGSQRVCTIMPIYDGPLFVTLDKNIFRYIPVYLYAHTHLNIGIMIEHVKCNPLRPIFDVFFWGQ